jgi:hypothetical protein
MFHAPSDALAVPPCAAGTRISMAPPCGFRHDEPGEERRRGRGTSGGLDCGGCGEERQMEQGAELRTRVELNPAMPRHN